MLAVDFHSGFIHCQLYAGQWSNWSSANDDSLDISVTAHVGRDVMSWCAGMLTGSWRRMIGVRCQ